MEIKYPIIIFICILALVLFFLIKVKKGKKNKRRVANSNILKKNEAYKNALRKYRILLYGIYAVVIIALLASTVLSSRIVKTQTASNDVYNRDIMLCMDVSSSVWRANLDLIESYKSIVSSLKGERFGISIFNTTSYLLVPLTSDYDYILDTLDTLYKSIDYNLNYLKYWNLDYNERKYLAKFIESGTIIDATSRGSSFSGDGLASCISDFPNLKEKRSRIIVLSTDNEVYGPGNNPNPKTAKQYVDITEASGISKNNNIVVYTLAPSTIRDDAAFELREATLLTGGEYYVHNKGQTVKSIVNNIESREKTLLEENDRTFEKDYPVVPFLVILFSFATLIVIDKKVIS